MNATSFTPAEEELDPYPFRDFAPTLSQCFVIVIVGYLLSRCEILSSGDVRGVVAFAGYFAMPGIICVSLADADFSDFRWELLFGIFLGKWIVFGAVVGLILRLHGNLGVAGLVATFCVHSNDLPVGNPLMSALYRVHRPQMMKYLFLIPAMTIVFFVPIGNIMLDIHRSRRKELRVQEDLPEDAKSKSSLRQHVLRKEHLQQIYGIPRHPVVIATALGLILNAISGGKLPEVVHQPIQVAAATIPGIALAMLGFSVVRRERHLISSSALPAAVLLLLKMVLTPVLLHTLMRMLTEDSRLLSDFALLYGILSPATVVFQLGREFRKPMAAMSVALILSSFACFPASYSVARFTIVPSPGLDAHVPCIRTLLFWAACLSLFSDVTACLLMVWRKQWLQFPCCYVMYFAVTQFLMSYGVLFWCLAGDRTPALYAKVVLYCGGEYSGYLWTGILSLVLAYRLKHPPMAESCFSVLLFTVFSLSVFLTMVICLLLPYYNGKSVYVVGTPSTSFQHLQLIMATVLLVVCLLVACACLMKYYEADQRKGVTEDPWAYENAAFTLQGEAMSSKPTSKDKEPSAERSDSHLYYGEVVRDGSHSEWTARLAGLVLLQVLVMATRLITHAYKLSRSQQWEVVVPLEYLQSTLFVGQGFFVLITFGVDVRTVIISLKRWWRQKMNGVSEEGRSCTQNPPSVPEQTPDDCTQFRRHHLARCFRDLAKNRRWKGCVYRDCFWGHQLVDWLITEGLCADDAEAEGRGQALLIGRVIAPVLGQHSFRDAPYLYHFVRRTLEPR